MNINELRQKYPQYNDMSDMELADAFHGKFYSDIPKEQFYTTLGISSQSKAMKGLEAIEPSVAPTPEHKAGVLEHIAAPIETAASLVLGAPAMGVANLYAAGKELLGGGKAEETLKSIEPWIPHPTTELGKQYTEKVGKALDPLNAVMPNLSMMHGLAQPALIRPPKTPEPQVKAKTIAEKYAEMEQKGKPVEQATELPKLPEEVPLIPDSWKEPLQPVEEARPLPVLPDQLKPLSEQYAKETPIGVVEEGGKWTGDGQKPLPEIPPQDKGLLSLTDEPLTPKLNDQSLARRHDVPTDEFPLRQEVLESPEIAQAIEAFRTEQARLQETIDNTINKFAKTKAEKELTALEQEFAAGMKQLGIDNAAEAHGLNRPLYEGGKETKLPVEKTFSPNAGKFGPGGGWTPFASSKKPKVPSYEEFTASLEAELGRKPSDNIAQKLYEQEYGEPSPRSKALGRIPGFKAKLDTWRSQDVGDIDGGVQRAVQAAESGDIAPVSSVFKNVTSPGRLQASIIDHPFVSRVVGFIKDSKDHYRVQTNNMMSDIHGMFNSFENAFSGGLKSIGTHSWKDAADVLRIRRANERNAEFKPEQVLSGKKLELFKAIDDSLNEVKTQVNKRLEELGKPPIKELPYYFTSWFKGDYVIPVYKIGADGTKKFLYNLRESNMKNAKNAKDWAQEKLGSEFIVEEPSLIEGSKWSDRRIDARVDFEELASLFGDTDPVVQEALTRLQEQTAVSAFGTREMPNRFKQKSGRIGSLGDRPWRTEKENYYDNKKALDMYIEGANEWLANTNIDLYMRKLQDSLGTDQMKNAQSFVGDYADYVTGRKENYIKIGKNIQNGAVNLLNKMTFGKAGDIASIKEDIRAYSNVKTALFIGWWSARAAFQNIVQPITAITRLTQLMARGDVQASPAHLAEAFVLGNVKGIGAVLGHNGAFRDYAPKALEFMEKHHVIDAHLVESARINNFYLNAAYDFAANKSVAMTEQVARSVAFNIYDSFFKAIGEKPESSMDLAKNLTHDTMVNYESYGKAQLFGRSGMVGDVAGRLQTFKTNSFTQTYEFAMDMKKNSPKTWVPFSLNMLQTLATAGAIGVVGMDVMEAMWDVVLEVDRSFGTPTAALQETSPKKFIMDNFSRKVSMGMLSDTTGLNLSGAFTQGLVGNNAAQSVVPILGDLPDVLMAPARMMGDDVSKAKALQAISPSSVRPLIEKKLLTAPNGTVVSSNTGEPVFNGKDSYLNSTNIQTLERGETGMRRFNFNKANQNVKESQRTILKKASGLAMEIAKQGMTPEIKQKIAEYNKAYAKLGGNPESVEQAIAQQAVEIGIGNPFNNAIIKNQTDPRLIKDAVKQRESIKQK